MGLTNQGMLFNPICALWTITKLWFGLFKHKHHISSRRSDPCMDCQNSASPRTGPWNFSICNISLRVCGIMLEYIPQTVNKAMARLPSFRSRDAIYDIPLCHCVLLRRASTTIPGSLVSLAGSCAFLAAMRTAWRAKGLQMSLDQLESFGTPTVFFPTLLKPLFDVMRRCFDENLMLLITNTSSTHDICKLFFCQISFALHRFSWLLRSR